MTYQEVFQAVKDKFKDADVSHINEKLAFQFNITGEGVYHAEVKSGRRYR